MDFAPGKVLQFYKDKGILVTGSTGFMGKVLVSKILRSFGPEISHLYLLIRPKKGKNTEERCAEITNGNPLFEGIFPSVLKKVVGVRGDITQENLGLSEKDRETLKENVNVVFHSAATVKFDDLLTLSVQMNVGGTLAMLDLAKEIKDLKSFIHVSTAYSQPQKTPLDERTYDEDFPFTPTELTDLIRLKGEKVNEPSETKKIIGNWPNTYTFTKAAAEKAAVEAFRAGIPISIMRPSVVVASHHDPIPGWVDNLNGPTGIIAGCGSGLLRTMWVQKKMVADLIPVDICINLLVVMASLKVDMKLMKPRVYNCISGDSNPITWGRVEKLMLFWIQKYPFEKMFWYPNGSFKEIKIVDRICQLFLHKIPAMIGDGFLILTFQTPFLNKVNKRMTGAFKTLEYFGSRVWEFKNPETRKLYETLNPEEKHEFNFDVRAVEWNSYLQSYALGVRHFLLKGTPDSIPFCKTKMNIFYSIHICLQTTLILLVGLFCNYLCRLIFT